MARRRWKDLSERDRRLIAAAAAFEGTLKVAALVDLARRPASQVRGSKGRWVAAIVFINALGAVPVSYFRFGRRPR